MSAQAIPVPVLGALGAQWLDPELMKGVPTGLLLIFVGGWVMLQFYREIEAYKRRHSGGDDERRAGSAELVTATAKLMSLITEIHDTIQLEPDPLGDPGRKAVYGLKPEVIERLSGALDVQQAVLVELKATRGTMGKMEHRLGAIEDALKRRAG